MKLTETIQRAIVTGVLLVCAVARGAIQYDSRQNIVWVTDCPAEFPCTLQRLLAADAACGWGKASRDAQTDTYTLDAHLYIGADDGTDTTFQLGTPEEPTPTLVVNGNVVVYPNPGSGRERTNRLRLGYPDAPDVTATLKIGNTADTGYSLYVGADPRNDKLAPACRGQLHVVNSTITAARSEPACAIGDPKRYGHIGLYGDSLHLVNSTVSRVKGNMTSGIACHLDIVVRNTVFEYGRSVLSNYRDHTGKKGFVGCVFRHMLGAAIADNGSLKTTLVDCVFEGNRSNWRIGWGEGLTLVDCTWEPPTDKDSLFRSEHAAKRGVWPAVCSRRHVVVEVTGPDARPIAGATVRVTGRHMQHALFALTGPDGKTPGRGAAGGILLTEFIRTALDADGATKTDSYTYDITASAPGYREAVSKDYAPTTSWDTVRLVLER